jgi:hypothetical protein
MHCYVLILMIIKSDNFFCFKVLKITKMKDFQSLIIEGTPKSPQIELNPITGDFIFSGRSIPENAAKVYEPILNWVTEYILDARPVTNLRFNIEYFNTSSSLWLARILKVLTKISQPDYVLFLHLYLPLEEFDELRGFEDIKDVFSPMEDIFQSAIPSVGIKLYGTNEHEEIIRDKMVFI